MKTMRIIHVEEDREKVIQLEKDLPELTLVTNTNEPCDIVLVCVTKAFMEATLGMNLTEIRDLAIYTKVILIVFNPSTFMFTPLGGLPRLPKERPLSCYPVENRVYMWAEILKTIKELS